MSGTAQASVPEGRAAGHQSAADDPAKSRFPVLMKTRNAVVVRRSWHDDSAILARVKKGAVLRMRYRRETSSGCPEGWLERSNEGFICARYLHREKTQQERPSPLDAPDILNGLEPAKVIQHRSRLYRGLRAIRHNRPVAIVNEESLLMIREKITFRDVEYYQTRKGWYVRADSVEKLPAFTDSLAVEIENGISPPGAIVVVDQAPVFASPDEAAEPVRTLSQWSAVSGTGNGPLVAEHGWVKLAEGSFVRDDALARIRPMVPPEGLEPGERWIAIDLQEQLLHAYEGDALVRVIPCSTGMEGNTEPGSYRIQWKRRMQTLRPEDYLRVEDVQWVMYYYPPKGIAIHAAYWHENFGKPVSHGCVNLPVRDARWAFEWSAPLALPEDSERFPIPRGTGTRVIVFD